jgi:DNA-binding MarR family transcriptional regulator
MAVAMTQDERNSPSAQARASAHDTPEPLDRALLLQALASCGSFNLRRAARLSCQRYDEQLADAGVRSTQLALLIMLAVNGPQPMAKLAYELAVDPSTLSRNLRPLERNGYLTITRGDNRAKLASLTRAGEDAIRRAVPRWKRAHDAFLAQVGAETWQKLLADLGALVRALRRDN